MSYENIHGKWNNKIWQNGLWLCVYGGSSFWLEESFDQPRVLSNVEKTNELSNLNSNDETNYNNNCANIVESVLFHLLSEARGRKKKL